MQGLKALHAVAAEDVQIRRVKDRRQQRLDLRGLSLAQIPDSLCRGKFDLTSLDLSYNQLTCLPPCISLLRQLRELRAAQNALRHLPDHLRLIVQLRLLDFSHNKLTEIPLCLDSLKCLEHANFSGNQITRLRVNSFALPRLRLFYVTRNPVENVPQSVYIDGLQAIRRFFNVNIVPQQVCRDVQYQYSSLCEEIKQLRLRHVINGERLGERTRQSKPLFLEDSHNERTSAFLVVRNGVASHKQLQRLESDGHFSTSDYGSCTGSNVGSGFRDQVDVDAISCCGDQGSDGEDILHEISEVEDTCDHCHQPLIPEVDFEDDDSIDFILPSRARFIKVGHAAVMIPEDNKSNIIRTDFFLELLEHQRFIPDTEDTIIHASSVAFLGPHGARFYDDRPAIIRLPIYVNVGVSRLRCFTSDTDDFETPLWMEIPSCDFHVYNGYVLIRTTHFSIFTVMLDKTTPTISQVIKKDEGGRLEVEQVPGVVVDFPQGSLTEDVTASVKVITYELSQQLRTNIPANDGLASPTVILQPHGYFFKSERDSRVVVQLPIPNYSKIIQHFGGEAQLSVWHSPTSENEPVRWERLDVNYLIRQDDDGNHSIAIPVEHFSWLTSLWDGIRGKLNNTGMAFGFYSGGAVNMKCQAWMLESSDTEKFGLVVICHRSDNTMQDVGNYANKVGGSLKPVSISSGGDIVVKLGRSDYFEADTAASEDPILEKVEANYRGGEFEMQFACRFKGPNKPKEREIFGKVFVKKRREDGNEERLFEFNLIKKSDEPDDTPEDPWTAASLKELADVHGITTGDNWKVFARELGFSYQDIRTRLGRAVDPFSEMVGMYRRQGHEYDEFMLVLNQVARKLRFHDDSSEESPAPNASGQQGWKQMWGLGGLGNWFGGGGGGGGGSGGGGGRGSTSGNRTPSQSGSSTPRSVQEEDESQPGPSGVQSKGRKRLCPTCEAGPTPSTSHFPTAHFAHKRLRLSPTTSESSGGSEELFQPLPPDRSPPHTPGHGTFCSLPTTSRYSPPHISHNLSMSSLPHAVNIHSSNPISTPGMGMTGMTGIYGASTSRMPTSGFMYNAPYTTAQYGSIPNTAQQTMPNPDQPPDQDNLSRNNLQEITQVQLYHIASLIHTTWVKVARFVRDDETLEGDIKSIKENHSSPEEQATQMLLQWREKCPDRCTRGVLYGALCDLNLKSVAKKCEHIYKKPR